MDFKEKYSYVNIVFVHSYAKKFFQHINLFQKKFQEECQTLSEWMSPHSFTPQVPCYNYDVWGKLEVEIITIKSIPEF